MKRLAILGIIFGMTLWSVTEVKAQEKYGVWVNPVRDLVRWQEPDIKHLEDQIKIGEAEKIVGTWLLQYGAIIDQDITKRLKTRTEDEVGAWLEVDQKLAKETEVYYDLQKPWYDPGVVFLSGYERGQRAKMIDKYYSEFKARFGYWPKSVGAWWIDSWSLNYIKNKYGLETVMIVADQKGTDGYGVWGQWTGVPYWPSNTNVLVPAKNLENNLGAVVIQWAQRDLELGYKGQGIEWSNNSVQANDYTNLGKDFEYFKKLADEYIGAGQITLGLEVGQEAVGQLTELERQIGYAKSQGVKMVTMSQFAGQFRENNGGVNQNKIVGDWKLTTTYRENLKLNQKVNYQENLAFGDYFKADKSSFLDRNLESLKPKATNYQPWWILLAVMFGLVAIIKKWSWWGWGLIFTLGSWGLVLRSTESFGWKVIYGPMSDNLMMLQIGVVAAGIGVSFWQRKRIKWLVAATGLIPIISSLRFTIIEGTKYFGIMAGNQWLGWPRGEFSDLQLKTMLRFPWEKVWDNQVLGLVIYPVVMIILGIGLSWVVGKMDNKFRKMIMVGLLVLAVINLVIIWQTAPRLVTQ